MFENTIKFCDELLSLGVPGFDLMVCKDGECVLRHMNGYSDVENKVQMNGKERYYMYSCSKVITCTAALQLWEKGMFSLEDMLSDYLPEFREMTVSTTEGLKKAENPILIKHLFEMTAGFSYRMNSPFLQKCKKDTNGECPTRETMKYLASITIVMAIPTIISGIYGMNVSSKWVPLADTPYGFIIICGIILLVCLIVAFFLKKRKML